MALKYPSITLPHRDRSSIGDPGAFSNQKVNRRLSVHIPPILPYAISQEYGCCHLESTSCSVRWLLTRSFTLSFFIGALEENFILVLWCKRWTSRHKKSPAKVIQFPKAASPYSRLSTSVVYGSPSKSRSRVTILIHKSSTDA